MNLLIKILIITNGLIIFYFLQLVLYGLLSYSYYFRKKKKLNFSIGSLTKLARLKNRELPFITIVIPAKEEAEIIEATIDRFSSLIYPKDKLCILIVCDEKEILTKPYEETTQYKVEKKQQYYNKIYNTELIKLTSVPAKFDGNYNGLILNTPVKSTKPRALNWALNFVPQQTEILGFYDADSHPDPETLLYVAYKFLTKQLNEYLLLQGPVVQVRNYFYLQPFNKIYAIAQAITHEWYLPTLLAHLPFIGGTNFFIEPHLIHKVGGFNKNVLSEDLELGCRLFIKTNVWPEFMPYIATEQTPPNYKSYFVQRVRWAAGYVQTLKSLLTEEGFLKKRFILSCLLLFYGILPWFVGQICIASGISLLFISLFGISKIILPTNVNIILISMNIAYILFLVSYYTYAMKKIYLVSKDNENKKGVLNNIKEYLTFLLTPVAATFGVLPYTYGFLTSMFNNNMDWKKTVRTIETKN